MAKNAVVMCISIPIYLVMSACSFLIAQISCNKCTWEGVFVSLAINMYYSLAVFMFFFIGQTVSFEDSSTFSCIVNINIYETSNNFQVVEKWNLTNM